MTLTRRVDRVLAPLPWRFVAFALALVVAARSFFTRPRFDLLPVILVVGLLAGSNKVTAYAASFAVIAMLVGGSLRELWRRLREDAFIERRVSQGAVFVVESADATTRRTRSMEVVLDASHRPADHAPKIAEITLPPDQAGLRRFRAEAGPVAAFEWATWYDVPLR